MVMTNAQQAYTKGSQIIKGSLVHSKQTITNLASEKSPFEDDIPLQLEPLHCQYYISLRLLLRAH